MDVGFSMLMKCEKRSVDALVGLWNTYRSVELFQLLVRPWQAAAEYAPHSG